MKFELLGFHSRAGCLLRNQNSRSAFKGKPSWLCGCYRESSAKIACITYVSMNRIQKMVIFITWFFRRPWHVCATVDKRTYSRPLHIHTRYSIVNGALFEIFNTKESIYIINCCSAQYGYDLFSYYSNWMKNTHYGENLSYLFTLFLQK